MDHGVYARRYIKRDRQVVHFFDQGGDPSYPHAEQMTDATEGGFTEKQEACESPIGRVGLREKTEKRIFGFLDGNP